MMITMRLLSIGSLFWIGISFINAAKTKDGMNATGHLDPQGSQTYHHLDILKQSDKETTRNLNGNDAHGLEEGDSIKCGRVDTLKRGDTLHIGKDIISQNGLYKLTMQGDGNLVIYEHMVGPIWASNTGKIGRNQPYRANFFQTEGNFVIWDGVNKALWQTATAYKGGVIMTLQDDGNFVMRNNDGSSPWDSASYTNSKLSPLPLKEAQKELYRYANNQIRRYPTDSIAKLWNPDIGKFETLPVQYMSCPALMDVRKEDCVAAGLSVGGKLRDGKLVEGRWSHIPTGCSLQDPSIHPTYAGDIHYNSNLHPTTNRGFRPICKKENYENIHCNTIRIGPDMPVKPIEGNTVECTGTAQDISGTYRFTENNILQKYPFQSVYDAWYPRNKKELKDCDDFGFTLDGIVDSCPDGYMYTSEEGCTFREMKKVEYSTKWRLWAKDKPYPIWDVYEVSFYSSRDCTGQKHTHGTAIASRSHGCCHENNAFDSNENSSWGGRPNDDAFGSQLWIGKEFDKQVQIRCVKFVQTRNSHGADEVVVQAWNGNMYENVASKTNLELENYIGLTTCSCNTSNADSTGRPIKFEARQENGEITFDFHDNSKCEEYFSFDRRKEGSDEKVSFTNDFHYIGSSQCSNDRISPGLEASDSLKFSKLQVGGIYEYSVRASARNYNLLTQTSDSTTIQHKVSWEASIYGKVTTEPNAGSLPIKGVEISYQLGVPTQASDPLTPAPNLNFQPISCDGCSGTTHTNVGGAFDIVFNLDHTDLYDSNENMFPVHITFSKISGGESHQFLCNDGEDDCSGGLGTVVYLKHLQFNDKLYVHDNTGVPFSGKVFIQDTVYRGSEGCPIANARIELIQKKKVMTETQEETLVSGFTKPDGSFTLPVILGSTVDYVKVDYHGHAFLPSPNSNFIAGQKIKESGFYGNNDFIDTSKAHLFVEVVGGLCDRGIGTSIIQINIPGCDWNPFKTEYIESDTKTMTRTRNVCNNLPAHRLEVQLMDIRDDQDSRHQHIYEHFQGPQPESRIIDLRDSVTVDNAVEKEKNISESNEAKKGTENNNYIEQEKKDEAAMEMEEEEETETVRFQYDGKLKVEVTVPHDELKCSSYSLVDYNNANSLHVVEYMERYNIKIDLKYEIINNQVYCDIVEAGLKITVDNQVGVDEQEGFQKFFNEEITNDASRQLLEYCSNTTCSFNVEHETNEQGNPLGKAGINFGPFAPGRPNISPPYVRSMIFKLYGGTQVLQHRAAFFVQGYYRKGEGESFALPTHKPIMILRDPPGGMSYATYNNIKTTFKIETSDTSVHMSHSFGFALKKKVGTKISLSTGLGGGILGAIFESCNDAFELESDIKISDFESETGGVVHQDNEKQSNKFSTMWTYKTSEDPWLAGPMSDVFVVPNLNVKYEPVYEVSWNNSTCGAVTDDKLTPPLPTKILFNIEAPSTKAAMSFYSRYHIKTVKLPELQRTLKVKQRNQNACANGFNSSGCPFTNEETDKIKNLEEEIALLKDDAIPAWEEVLEFGEKENQQTFTSILNWFEKVADQKELNAAVQIEDHTSSIAPPAITNNAAALKDLSYEDKIKDPTKIERIQFSGGGNTMAMQMNYEKVSEHMTNSCWKGCNVDSNIEIGLPSLDLFSTKVFENGIQGSFNPGGIKIKTSHTSTKTSQEEDSTSVGFVLGDQDPQDEFVIDIFADETYGTLMFKTVAGRSKCPHEVNTAAIEDPRMEISKYPSQFVFPDDKMIFELELSNMGVGEESLFVLYAQHRDNRDGLDLKLDGGPFVSSREFTNIKKDTSYYKTVTVGRGSRLYRNEPIDIIFESACEDSNSLVNDLTASAFPQTKSVTRTLFNFEDGDANKKYLEFVEPCPNVQWAGYINRNNGFVVNTKSSDQDILNVLVFNPNHSKKTFKDMTSDRLEHIYLKYRKIGDIAWKKGQMEVFNQNTNRNDVFDLDFASERGIESAYGYISMDWRIGLPFVKEGTYEIKVGSECMNLGGPDDIDRFDAPILHGVIDLTRPEQYGKPIPLRDQIFIGEEIVVVFTEPLQCEKPLSFDMQLTIAGTEYIFQKEELQVICEERKIRFQFDPTVGVNVEDIMGKDFTVEIGKIGSESRSTIMDKNGNGLNPNVGNVKFTKTFASLKLEETATSFVFRFETVCFDATIDSFVDDTKNYIATLLDLPDTSRVELNDMSCHEGSTVIARVKLNPSTRRGRLLRLGGGGDNYHSLNLFYKLRDVMEKNEIQRKRNLGVIVDWLGDDGFIEDRVPLEPSSLSDAKIASYKNEDYNEYDGNNAMFQNEADEDMRGMENEEKEYDEEEEGNSRLLHQMQFHLSDMKILPCVDDMELFKTHSDLIEKEEILLHVALLEEDENVVNNAPVIIEDLKVDMHSMLEEIRKLHDHEDHLEMKSLQMEYVVVTLICSSVLLVLYYRLKKR